MLLSGLNQPHGLAFAGSTLYVAQDDQVDAHAYADGKVSDRRTVADELPDASCPDLRGAYACALKSVAPAVAAVQGPDGAVYVSDDSAGTIYRMEPPAR